MHTACKSNVRGVQGIVRVKNMWAKGTGDEKGDAVPRERIARGDEGAHRRAGGRGRPAQQKGLRKA